jgi:DNA-binding SARP family transcriptional activator
MLIEPFAELPALDLLEVASRHLTAAVAAEGRAETVPRIRLVRVGPNGVELLLAERRSWAPGSFCSTDDGHTWMLPASVDGDALATDARRHPVWMPALVPIGDDAHGTYLVSLEPGGALPVTGPDAPRALSAMQVAAMSWPWSEQLTVTDDPARAANEALAVTDPSVTDERLRVVFVGDATALDEATRQRVSILGATTEPDDLAVVAADGRGTIKPLGISLDLCRFEQSDQAEAVDELMESAARAAQDAGVPRGEGSAELMSPGPVEVRLLTAVPRIDGLVEPLDGLARRATELVAYLALQEGRPVEGDRLRARVLGPADADAAPRTMMNLASAARRSLGLDAGGMPRLSKASNSGLYRLSPEVTTDVDRLVHMARAGVAADDTVAAVELCTAALELVEDEPLCAAGGRYAWWQAEQAGRLANAAVDAACRLAELADTGATDVSASRRGIERARLLAPWDEALDRAAMTVEHAAGNRPGIERAYAECKRKAEELAPGALPSERTEDLYAALTRRSPPLAADDPEETVATAALG